MTDYAGGIGDALGSLLHAVGLGFGAYGQKRQEQQQRQHQATALEKIAPGYGGALSQLSPEDRKVALDKFIEDPVARLFRNRLEGGTNHGFAEGDYPGLAKLYEGSSHTQMVGRPGLEAGTLGGLQKLGILPSSSEEMAPGGDLAQARQRQMQIQAPGLGEDEENYLAAAGKTQLASQLQRNRLEREKTELKISEARRKEGREDSKEYNDFVSKAGRKAKNQLPLIKRSQRLIQEGDNPNPAFWAGLKFFDLDFPSFLSADAQERQKLIVGLLGDVKDTFGSRPPLGEIEIFMRGLPDLVNTPEGALRALRNMEIMSEIALNTDKVRRQVIKENGGTRPGDLEDRVEELTEAYNQKKWDEFINGPVGSQSSQSSIPPAPKGYVNVRSANGEIGTIPQDKLEKFLSNKAGTLLE